MRKLYKNIFILLFGLTITSQAYSQDIHFSQFYNSPLSLNPALTGFMKEDYRVSVIYRNQWKQINARFLSVGFAGDMNFRPNFSKSDKIGVGLLVFRDDLGGGIIKNNSAFLSASYIKTLDHAQRLKISAGLQAGYVQKSIDYSVLYFSSQINNYQYDPSLASGEDISKSTFNYINLNAGIGGSYQVNDKVKLFSGLSFFNINSPKENFASLVQEVNRLKGRFTYSGSMDYLINQKWSIHPAVLVMKQTKVMDFNAGSSIGYSLNQNRSTMIQAGLWYRYSDALIFMSGLKYNNLKIALSYDLTTSGLRSAKKDPAIKDNAQVGAWEVTLTYVGFLKRPLPGELTIPCRFF